MFASEFVFEKYMKESNFEDVNITKCFSPHLKNSMISEPKSVFLKSFRNSESNFSLYTEAETEIALNTLTDLLAIYGEDYFKDLMKQEVKIYGTRMQLSAIRKA